MGVYDFRLPLDFFEQLTFAEFCDIAYRHSLSQEREQFFYWQICTHIRWAMGDKKADLRELAPHGLTDDAPVLSESPGAESSAQAAMERRFLAAMSSIGITPELA